MTKPRRPVPTARRRASLNTSYAPAQVRWLPRLGCSDIRPHIVPRETIAGCRGGSADRPRRRLGVIMAVARGQPRPVQLGATARAPEAALRSAANGCLMKALVSRAEAARTSPSLRARSAGSRQRSGGYDCQADFRLEGAALDRGRLAALPQATATSASPLLRDGRCALAVEPFGSLSKLDRWRQVLGPESCGTKHALEVYAYASAVEGRAPPAAAFHMWPGTARAGLTSAAFHVERSSTLGSATSAPVKATRVPRRLGRPLTCTSRWSAREFGGLLGAAGLRRGHDLDERHARAVEIDVRN